MGLLWTRDVIEYYEVMRRMSIRDAVVEISILVDSKKRRICLLELYLRTQLLITKYKSQ